MRLEIYKRNAELLLGVPKTMPVADMLNMAIEKYKVLCDIPQSKLEKARLLAAILMQQSIRRRH